MIKRIALIALLSLLSTNALSYDHILNTFNYPPFTQEDNQGFIDRFVTEFIKLSKIDIEVQKFPPKRSLRYYKKGLYPFHFGSLDNFTKEINENSYFIPILDIDMLFVYLKINESRLGRDLKDLKGSSIAILRGAEEELKLAQMYELTIANYTDTTQALKLLEASRVDFISFCPLFADSKTLLNDKFHSSKKIYTTTIGFYIHKDSQDSKQNYQKMSRELQRFLKSKTYRRLLTKEFPKGVPKSIEKYTK